MMERKSQNELIYEFYKNGGTLTTLEALNLFCTMNLRSRNSDIEKRHGIKLDREMVTDTNTGKHYNKYFISKPKLF